MKAESAVTFWHFSDNADVPQRRVYKNAYIDSVNRISKNGIRQKGFFDAKSCTVRIPLAEEFVILPGDYMTIGEDTAEFFDVENSLKIMEVKDNRRGSNPHWKILCGG